MRRKEFLITDAEPLIEVLNRCEWGTLALVDAAGAPYQTPINHTWYDFALWFHSAQGGRKIKILKTNPTVHFNAVAPLSLIPSFYTDEKMACNASQFFLSVSIVGQAEMVADLALKTQVLSTMMKRLQPEGGYQPINPDDEAYLKELKKTGVIRITPQSMSGKFKLGQNLTEEKKRHLIAELKKRGEPLDLITIDWIQKFTQS